MTTANQPSVLNYFVKNALILVLSLSLILFTQWIKLMKYGSPEITVDTILGLCCLGIFAMIGMFIQWLLRNNPIKFVREFPILGWVSLTSLFFCMISDYVIQVINAVDFLSITTPILTFAGISVANRLGQLRSMSWKIAITAIFVFIGTYLGAASLAELGFLVTGHQG